MADNDKPTVVFTRSHLSKEEEYGRFRDVGSVEIPNGLCYLSAATRAAGYRTVLIDAHAMNMANERLTERIIGEGAKYVGISANTINIYYAADLAERLKKADPKITVIVGGPHMTAVPEETLKRFPDIDIGVIGEGEDTIVELLSALESSSGLKSVRGLIFRNGAEFVITEKRPFIMDLDRLAPPAFDLLPDFKKYYKPPAWSMHAKTSALLITSRGCPSQCTFCDRAVFGNVCRAHSTEYVMKLIRDLYNNYGVRHLRLNEDNLLIFRKRLEEICNTIIDEKLDISWSCFARVDFVDADILRLMKRAGCWQISYGIESGEQRILDEEKKHLKLEQIERAVRLTKRFGIRVVGFNMIAHPLETVESMKKTIDFNKRIGVDDFKAEFLIPFPGTELNRTAEQYGKFDNDWRKMGVYKGPIFVPNGLTEELLEEWNMRGTWQFYLQPRVILSYLSQVRGPGDLKTLFVGGSVVFSILLDSMRSKLAAGAAS